ncbi:MAG: type IVB secretion system coupling complex protein DotM/IcmP [Gammaproteobacteria bacterium]
MPPQGGGGGGQQPDSGLGPLWVVLTIFIGGLVLWYTGHTYITKIIFSIRLGEIAAISLFTNSLDAVRAQIMATSPSDATFQFIATISQQVGAKLAIPLAVILCGMAAVLYRMNAKNRYRKVYSMHMLLEQEKNNWPQITPVSKLNLLDIHIHEGPWAMSMTPMQFAKKYKLLEEERVADSSGLASRSKLVVKVIESKATRVFTQQLGRPWRGADKLPIHAKAILAILIAKANADRDAANKLIRQIASSSEHLGRLNFSGIEPILKKYMDTKIVKKAINAHAYELTVMATILEVARLDGVLATAEFLWLKPIDRSLWYMLNNVGRRTAFTEVAGPFAHWLAEKAIGRKLLIPMVQEATTALVAAVEEVVYNPEQDF